MLFHQLPLIFYVYLSHFLNAYDFEALYSYLRLSHVRAFTLDNLKNILARKFRQLEIIEHDILNSQLDVVALRLQTLDRCYDQRFCFRIYQQIVSWNLRQLNTVLSSMKEYPKHFLIYLLNSNKVNDKVALYILQEYSDLYARLVRSGYDVARFYSLGNVKTYPYKLRCLFRELKESDKNRVYNQLLAKHDREYYSSTGDLETIEVIENFFILLMGL